MGLLPQNAVEFINDLVHPIAAICGICFPFLRVACRYFYNIKPYYKGCIYIQDVSNGAALPYFCIMIVSPLAEGIIISPLVIFLAGVYGSHAIIKDLLRK